MILGLISDFLSFVSSALRCIENDQMVPAISLLRKPLTDNLAYLEMLALDPEGMVKQFQGGFRNIDNLRKTDDFFPKIQKVIDIFTKELKNHNLPFIEYTGKDIWNMRYYRDKNLSKFKLDKNEEGFSNLPTLFEWATHLWTAHYNAGVNQDIRTETNSINMDDIMHIDCCKFYLRQIYGTLPILLYHMANLTDYLIKKFDVFGGNGNDKWSTYIAIMAWTKISKKIICCF